MQARDSPKEPIFPPPSRELKYLAFYDKIRDIPPSTRVV